MTKEDFNDIANGRENLLVSTPKYSIYTANQPLCLGGQIYMWNRYNACGAIVHMPDAQFTKGGHQNRIELLTTDGNKQWVIFPIKDRYLKPINECVLFELTQTVKKILKTFDALYARFDHYRKLREDFHATLRNIANFYPFCRLDQFNDLMFLWVKEHLGLNIQEFNTTDLFKNRPEHPSEWVAQMGFAIGCKLYLGGGAAQAAYLREEDFKCRGMSFVAQNYKMPEYKRSSGVTNSDAMVSILDPLFVGGKDLVLELINTSPV